MESTPQKNIRTMEELNDFEPEKALAKERGIFERFSGKAKKIGNVMLLVSVLAMTSGVASKVNAQEQKGSDTKTEQVQKDQEEKIDESKLTESSKLFRGIVKSAKVDMGKIKTQEDANWLIRTHFGHFVSEYYMPTEGNVKEGAYGTKTRDYSEEDLKLVLQEAKEMKKIFEDLNVKFKVEAFSSRMEQIDDLIKKVENRSSYSGQKQKALSDKMLKQYQ